MKARKPSRKSESLIGKIAKGGLAPVLRRSLESILLIQETDELIKHGEGFRQEAVRKSTLNKWVSQYRPPDLVTAPSSLISIAVASLGGLSVTG